MNDDRSLLAARERLAEWQAAVRELQQREAQLFKAMAEYGSLLTEPPRALIIEVERQRDTTDLFDIALAALDAHSVIRTGHTGFGSLN